jgi:hypothetical protein
MLAPREGAVKPRSGRERLQLEAIRKKTTASAVAGGVHVNGPIWVQVGTGR